MTNQTPEQRITMPRKTRSERRDRGIRRCPRKSRSGQALESAPENPGVALENAPINPEVALENAPEKPEVDEETETLENAPENPGVNGQQAEPGPDDDDHDELKQQMDVQYGARTREGLRARRERKFVHLFATVEVEIVQEEDDPDSPVNSTTGAHLATPQMSMKRGLKMFGSDGVAAVKKRTVSAARPKSNGKLNMLLELIIVL